jgi:hypothetical protein
MKITTDTLVREYNDGGTCYLRKGAGDRFAFCLAFNSRIEAFAKQLARDTDLTARLTKRNRWCVTMSGKKAVRFAVMLLAWVNERKHDRIWYVLRRWFSYTLKGQSWTEVMLEKAEEKRKSEQAYYGWTYP